MNALRTKPWLLVLLLALFATQLAVPFSQVIREEAIRRNGTLFRLALRPVDPYDLMRGRYLALAFPPPPQPLNAPAGKQAGDTVYAVLQKDTDGIAYIARLSATPEADAFAAPLKTIFSWTNETDPTATETQLSVDIPLRRFYLPEEDAKLLDRILARPLGDAETGVQAALDVRIADGRIVAESLWLDGRPYREWLQDHLARQADSQP